MWFPAKLTIPKAWLILFFPLYTFCDKFDMFAVSASDNSIFPDLDIVRDKCALNDCAFLNLGTRHQYAVDDFGSGGYLCSGEQNGVLNFAVDHASLCNECLLDLGVSSYVLRKRRHILCVDLPARIVKVELIVLAEKIHICLPEGIDRSDIFPISFELISVEQFSVIQQCR